MSTPGLSSQYGSSSSSSPHSTFPSSSSSSSASMSHLTSNTPSFSPVDIENKQRALEIITEVFGVKTKSPDKMPSENKCFKAVYKACSERNWRKIEGQTESISLLLNKQGRSLLQEAIYLKNADLAEELITRKISVHTVDPEGNKPIHYIADQFNDLRLLHSISFHNSRDVRNYSGVTPLHLAAEKGHNQIIQSLIGGGANLNGVGAFKMAGQTFHLTPLAIATIKGHYETIDLLLRENKRDPALNLDLTFGNHGSLLHLLIAFDQVEVLDRLLRDHYDQLSPLLEGRNFEGMTPFLFAASRGNQDALLVLKKRNVDINARSPNKRSAYHYAAISRQPGTLTLLARMGCEWLTSSDAERMRPLDYVINFRDTASQSTTGVLENLEDLGVKLKDAPPSFDVTPMEGIAFQGGGPKGIGYVGVIEELERLGKMHEVKRVSGTSAGAITAALIGFGYSGKDTKKTLKETSLTSFLDHPLSLENLGKKIKNNLFRLLNPINWIKEPLKALWRATGLCKGKVFLNWMEDRIQEGLRKQGIEEDKCKNCTFGELRAMIEKGMPFKHIHVFATNIEKDGEIVCLSSEDPRFDNVIISHAIRASMSIPFIFEPHILRVKSADGRVDPCPSLGRFVDGGMLYNFPLEAFDKRKFQTDTPLNPDAGEAPIVNRRTLGFSLFSPEEEPIPGEGQIKTLKDLLTGILKAYFHAETLRRNLAPYNEQRIVHIDNTGVGTLDFDLSEARQNALIESGRRATRNFLSAQTASGMRHGLHVLNSVVVNTPGTGVVQLRQKHPDFVGREALLQQLQGVLVLGTSSSSSQSSASSSNAIGHSSPSGSSVAVLWGPKGVGKTETAIAFANNQSTHFHTIGWIYAANEHSRDQSYRRLAEKLDIEIPLNATSQEVENAVHQYLKNEHPNPYLLVFDGAEPGINIPRDGHGSILITTTEEYSFEGELRRPVLNFTIEEASQLLAKMEETPEDVNRLAELLNNNPLRLNQALRLLQNDSKMTIPAYIERLNQGITPFQLLLNRLSEKEPEALSWLKVCSNLQSDSIPTDWLESWLTTESPESNDVERTLKKGRIQRLLTDLGLLRHDESTNSFSLTGSVREDTMRVAGIGDRDAVIAKTLNLIAAQGNMLNINPANNLQGYGQWVQHADAILKIVESNSRNLQEASIRAQLGRWNLYRRSYNEAKQLFEVALHSYTTVFGEQARRETASILSELGTVELALNNPQAAVEYFGRGSTQWDQLNNERDSLDTANALNHFGSILHSLNHPEEAKAPLLRALAMLRRLFPGINKPEIATCAMNLGLTQIAIGGVQEVREAQESLTEALALWRLIHNNNQNTKEIVTCLTKLGSISFNSEQYPTAEIQLTEALRRQKMVSERGCEETIDLLMLLGKTFHRRNKADEAKKHFNEAFEMAEHLYGDRQDPRVQVLRNESKRFGQQGCVIA